MQIDAEHDRVRNMMTATATQPLLRDLLGQVLRDLRKAQDRTLRQVAKDGGVSLGYLSEIERGQKEASSELLNAICDALGVPLWYVLREVSDRLAVADGTVAPDLMPEGVVPVTLIS